MKYVYRNTSPVSYWGRYYGWSHDNSVVEDINQVLDRYFENNALKFRAMNTTHKNMALKVWKQKQNAKTSANSTKPERGAQGKRKAVD